MFKDKKAISDVVATVLIILITVAAVAIIWTAIMPMIRDKLPTSGGCTDAQTDLQIISNEGRTCVNSTGVNVQYGRGVKDYELENVQVIISKDGSSVETQDGCTAPEANEEKTCYIPETGLTTGVVKVKIAAIVKVGATTETCDVSQEVTLQQC